MNKFIPLLAFVAIPALASPNFQRGDESFSPALQIAKRVAVMENEKGLPSRAVWLGQRVARHAKLALEQSKKTGKRPASLTE